MDGPIVHALLGLLDQRLAEHLPSKVLRDTVDLLQGLVDRHGAHRDRAVPDDPLPRLVDVLPGAEIHEIVRAPQSAPLELLHLLLDVGGHCGVADVGVDLHLELAADDHRLGLGMVAVRWDDAAPACHLGPHELRIHTLAGSNEGHLLGDDAALGVVHLRATLAGTITGFTGFDPLRTELWLALARIDVQGAAGVVDIQVPAALILIIEVDATTRHSQNLSGGLVYHFLVELLRLGERLLEVHHVLELRVVRVRCRAGALRALWLLPSSGTATALVQGHPEPARNGQRGSAWQGAAIGRFGPLPGGGRRP
mmetsp:Transcript_64029/g.88552  ORF Transcript_64029/g.88552 Transcript_64029/m.88552 type:complete len:310 (-) Transcript_64029:165-1094(-)